jgi:3-hydroxybutyrate dehydrogenase
MWEKPKNHKLQATSHMLLFFMKRIAVITGGASGIGAACAEMLAKECKVVIVDMSEEKGLELSQKLNGYFIRADLSKREDCKNLVSETVKQFGGLDILINNAGFQHIDAIKDFPEDTWEKMLAVMLTAPFLLTKYAWEYLTKSGQGRVINIGSVHSLVASPFKSAYVTAKHGLVGFTKTVALEGAPLGLTCNTICPAYVRTPLVEKQIADQARTRGISESEVEEKVFLEPVAIKRMLEPSDVANYVAFLASEESWAITGGVQTMDLGWTAR